MPSITVTYTSIFDILFDDVVRSEGPPKVYDIGSVYYDISDDELKVYNYDRTWKTILKPSELTMKLVDNLLEYGNVTISEDGNIIIKTDKENIDIILSRVLYEIENCRFYLLENNEEKYIKLAYKIKVDTNDIILEKNRIDD